MFEQRRTHSPLRIWNGLGAGLAAGAAGTTALNALTYLDMAARGRPSSSTPQETVEKLAERTGIAVPGDQETRQNRLAGLGPLSGLAAGLGVGAALGLARALGLRPGLLVAGMAAGVGAMAASDAPMTALGVTDPRSWAARDWVSDAVPHVAYGLVTAAVVRRLDQD